MEVKDNFLDNVHLIQLDELIDNPYFAWYLQKTQVDFAAPTSLIGTNDGYWFSHRIYAEDEPTSPSYNPMIEIFKNYFKYISLCRITVNLLFKQETPSISAFHTDFNEKKLTTAIFYLSTNNGATEIEGGDRIDCVRNRLIMFPAITPHRAIGQTDVKQRIVLNFNFIL